MRGSGIKLMCACVCLCLCCLQTHLSGCYPLKPFFPPSVSLSRKKATAFLGWEECCSDNNLPWAALSVFLVIKMHSHADLSLSFMLPHSCFITFTCPDHILCLYLLSSGLFPIQSRMHLSSYSLCLVSLFLSSGLYFQLTLTRENICTLKHFYLLQNRTRVARSSGLMCLHVCVSVLFDIGAFCISSLCLLTSVSLISEYRALISTYE